MKRISTVLTIAFAIALAAGAQTRQQSFQEFRKGMHKDYQEFRSRILTQYADFLNGVWHPYEPMDMPGKYSKPKPKTQPRIDVKVPKIPAVEIPAPVVAEIPEPVMPKPATPQTPAGQASGVGQETVPFFKMEIAVPRIDFKILNSVRSTKETPAQWKILESGDARKAARALKQTAERMGFNGYLTYLLTSDYVASKFPHADKGAQLSTVHYLLANMGYGVRLAISESGMPLLLIPFAQKVYGSIYLTIDGKNYTVFAPEGTDISRTMNGKIYTCALPEGEDVGEDIDLRLNGLNIPYSPYRFDIQGAGITIKGETNANLFPLLYHYPQMPTCDFATSVLDPKVRESIISQVKTQLGGLGNEEAVNRLMGWFHSALEYATDEERHGFEKPYFLEELLYYDKCDCEDRAIAFTWMLWNALGIENHLIAFPMHESAAVGIESSRQGYSYQYDGKTFWSADPTYVGSKVGDVMPAFRTMAPQIDKTYSR